MILPEKMMYHIKIQRNGQRDWNIYRSEHS